MRKTVKLFEKPRLLGDMFTLGGSIIRDLKAKRTGATMLQMAKSIRVNQTYKPNI